MKKLLIALVLACGLAAAPANAALKVFACEPEWAALAAELGGDRVSTFSATTAKQDPHRIEARPSLIAKLRNADILVCTGADLEAGWLPALLRSAANPAVRPGARGYFEAAHYVSMLEVPVRLDRAEGDVHAAGNPHIQTDPHNIARVAVALTQRLAEIDPAQASHYQARHRDFSTRWSAAIQRWEKHATSLRNTAVVVQHRGFPYLERWLGLRAVAALEPKPGVSASAAHLAQVLARLKSQPAKMVLRAAYQDGKPSEWLAQQTGIRAVVLPYTVGGSERATDLFGLFDDTITHLLEANR